MEKKQSLPEYLKQLWKFHGYKQKDIASQLNITRQTYSHYETGRITPSINVLYHLAQIYGITVDAILKQVEIEVKNIPVNEISSQNTDKVPESLFQKEFLSWFQSLNEKDRRETLSIMWEIMQVKKKTGGGGTT